MEHAEKAPSALWHLDVLRFAPVILIVLALAMGPLVLPSFVQGIMTKVLIFAIFAMSLDLLWGYTGLISLGHAAYFGAGGYVVGVLMLHYGVNSLWVSLPAGVLFSGILAALLGPIALRLAGPYFLVITVALGELLFSLAMKIKWLSSQGTEGIAGISHPSLGLPWKIWNATSFYYFVFLTFIVSFFLLHRLLKSPFGYALQGIRDNPLRMGALGYNIWLYKYLSYIIGGLFGGLGGVLFAYHNGVVVPFDFALGTSVLPLLIIIIGGVGTLYGALIGSLILITLEFYVGIVIPERWTLILGIIFVLSIMYCRRGIGVYLYDMWRRFIVRCMPSR